MLLQVRDDTVVHVWKWWWPRQGAEASQEATLEASREQQPLPAASEPSLNPAQNAWKAAGARVWNAVEDLRVAAAALMRQARGQLPDRALRIQARSRLCAFSGVLWHAWKAAGPRVWNAVEDLRVAAAAFLRQARR